MKAVDFEMDEGTPINASRGGIVFEIKEDSMIGGKEKERYIKHSNFIKIYHGDGSYAVYSHLKYNGALVNVGGDIELGQLLGFSGSTGWSSGPHLQFDVNVLDSTDNGTLVKSWINKSRYRSGRRYRVPNTVSLCYTEKHY